MLVIYFRLCDNNGSYLYYVIIRFYYVGFVNLFDDLNRYIFFSILLIMVLFIYICF